MGFKSPAKILKRLARALKPKHKCDAPAPKSTPASAPQTRMTPFPELPLDVYDLIIDLVWPDRDTLLACALTCRAWHARSRANLFYRVELYNLAQLSHYSAQLAADARVGYALRELYVTPYHSQSQLLGAFPFELAAAGRRLPALTRLRVDIRRDFYPYIHPDFYPALASFAGVTTLELWRVQFPTLGDFAALVCALPGLRSLACWQVDWVRKTYDAGALRDRKQCLRLHSLELRDMDWSEAFADWLFMAVTVQDLRTVSMLGVATKDVEYIEHLLEAAGSSVRCLDIGIVTRRSARPRTKAMSEWEGDVGTYPRLVHNTSLTSLALHLDLKGDWAPGFLSQSSFPAIREITIRLPRLRKPTKVKHIRLDALDSILSLPQFAGVRRLVVECDAGADTPAQMDAYRVEVSCRLPFSCGRGVVAIRPRKAAEPLMKPPRPVVTKSKSEPKPELWDPY